MFICREDVGDDNLFVFTSSIAVEYLSKNSTTEICAIIATTTQYGSFRNTRKSKQQPRARLEYRDFEMIVLSSLVLRESVTNSFCFVHVHIITSTTFKYRQFTTAAFSLCSGTFCFNT